MTGIFKRKINLEVLSYLYLDVICLTAWERSKEKQNKTKYNNKNRHSFEGLKLYLLSICI